MTFVAAWQASFQPSNAAINIVVRLVVSSHMFQMYNETVEAAARFCRR